MSPEEFNSVDEIMVTFNERSYMCQYLSNKPHKWGFCTGASGFICGRIGKSGFLYDLDVYQVHFNKNNSTFGVSGNVVVNLSSSLRKQENHQVFADKFFVSLPINEPLE